MRESKSLALPLGYSPITGGEWRIRTAEPLGDGLQPPAFSHFANSPLNNNVVLTKGLEPSTYWLLVNCSTNWAKSSFILFFKSKNLFNYTKKIKLKSIFFINIFKKILKLFCNLFLNKKALWAEYLFNKSRIVNTFIYYKSKYYVHLIGLNKHYGLMILNYSRQINYILKFIKFQYLKIIFLNIFIIL